MRALRQQITPLDGTAIDFGRHLPKAGIFTMSVISSPWRILPVSTAGSFFLRMKKNKNRGEFSRMSDPEYKKAFDVFMQDIADTLADLPLDESDLYHSASCEFWRGATCNCDINKASKHD